MEENSIDKVLNKNKPRLKTHCEFLDEDNSSFEKVIISHLKVEEKFRTYRETIGRIYRIKDSVDKFTKATA